MALEVKKARFNPFVLPSDFFKADGDPVYHYGAVNSHFSVYLAIFSMVTIQQLGDPSANLLVTSRKAVFCNNTHVQWETWF